MSILLNITAFIVAIGILVTFHEFGHYWVARKSGVKVLKFSVGFGSALFSWQGKDGVCYQISAIPLGGYVKMLDENEDKDKDIDPADLPHAFNRQSLSIRTAVVAAGPLANFLLAFILLFFMFIVGISGVRPVIGLVEEGSPAAKAGLQNGDEITQVNDKSVKSWREVGINVIAIDAPHQDLLLNLRPENTTLEKRVVIETDGLNLLDDKGYMAVLGIREAIPNIPARIAEVVLGSAAQRHGLQAGDEIVAFNNEKISGWSDLVGLIQQNPTETIDFSVMRNGLIEVIPVRIDSEERDDQLFGYIGVRVDQDQVKEEMLKYRVVTQYNALSAIHFALLDTWNLTTLTLKVLWKMLTGSASLKNLSGPIMIAEIMGISLSIGIGTYLNTLALLSISIGILNLLPIPMLDGGHLLYYLIEFLKGSPLSEQAMIFAQGIGLALLGSIMLLAIYNDIYRLIG